MRRLAGVFCEEAARNGWTVTEEEAAPFLGQRLDALAASLDIHPRSALRYLSEEDVRAIVRSSLPDVRLAGLTDDLDHRPVDVSARVLGALIADLGQVGRYAVSTSDGDLANLAGDALAGIGEAIGERASVEA